MAVEIILSQTGHIQLALAKNTGWPDGGTQMAFNIQSSSGANCPIAVISSGYAEIASIVVAGG